MKCLSVGFCLALICGRFCSATPVLLNEHITPGCGFLGRLIRLRLDSSEMELLSSYQLQPYSFTWESTLPVSYNINKLRCPSSEIKFAMFSPHGRSGPLPLVVYFGGLGETGTAFSKMFNQRGFFQRFTSTEFQKRHPCHIIAPLIPANGQLCSGAPESPSNLAALVCDAMYATIREMKPNSVDTNRLYVTGLSSGGSWAYALLSAYPGRFAAAVPIVGYQAPEMIPASCPGNYWALFNERIPHFEEYRRNLEDVASTVRSCGGDFRLSTFPAEGHNAWDAAWKEDGVWDWMFSKTADGRPVRDSRRDINSVPKGGRSENQIKWFCTSSTLPANDEVRLDRCMDGLESTAFSSVDNAKRGDWLQIEFSSPVRGRIVVKTGFLNGGKRLRKGHLEVSREGRTWTRNGTISQKTGETKIRLVEPIRFLKLVVDADQQDPFVVRLVNIAP